MSEYRIVVSRNNLYAILFLVLFLLLAVEACTGFIFTFLLNSPSSLFYALLNWFLLSFSFFVLCRSLWHLFARHFFAGDPLLAVNDQGIFVGKIPGILGEMFIPWSEIDRIAVDRANRLRFYLKRRKPYLAQFSLWKRVSLLLCWPGAISVAQFWAATPWDQFLQQIRLHYAKELQAHQVRLEVPSHKERTVPQDN